MYFPCLVVFLYGNQIKICCKLSPPYLFLQVKQENIHDWKASFIFRGNYLGDANLMSDYILELIIPPYQLKREISHDLQGLH